jgi:cell division septum initiation protein DivIVA
MRNLGIDIKHYDLDDLDDFIEDLRDTLEELVNTYRESSEVNDKIAVEIQMLTLANPIMESIKKSKDTFKNSKVESVKKSTETSKKPTVESVKKTNKPFKNNKKKNAVNELADELADLFGGLTLKKPMLIPIPNKRNTSINDLSALFSKTGLL